jgi:predicted nucleic acid-binding protein
MKPLIVVDSGVLLALWDTDDPQHQAATAALERHLAAGSRLIVPVTTLTEVLIGAFQTTPHAVRTIEAFVEDLVSEVRAADRAVGRAAARLQADHPTLPLADALLLATGEVTDAQEILTTNQRLEQLDRRVQVLTGS